MCQSEGHCGTGFRHQDKSRETSDGALTDSALGCSESGVCHPTPCHLHSRDSQVAHAATPYLPQNLALNLQQFPSTRLRQAANGAVTSPAQLSLFRWQKPLRVGQDGQAGAPLMLTVSTPQPLPSHSQTSDRLAGTDFTGFLPGHISLHVTHQHHFRPLYLVSFYFSYFATM